MGVEISNLARRPEFLATTADRIWNAWWRSRGTARSEIEERLRQIVSSSAYPFSLVAHRHETFVGTASVIPSDLDALPDLTPWVAAVWVEPEHRHHGTGSHLVADAVQRPFAIGKSPVYLCARPHLRSFYERGGWVEIARGIDAEELSVFRMDRDSPAEGVTREE